MSNLTVRVSPSGPDAGHMKALEEKVLVPAVEGLSVIADAPVSAVPSAAARYRLFSFQLVPPQDKASGAVQSDGYQATIHDYGRNRSFIVEGRLDGEQPAEIRDSGSPPLPDWEEFQTAVEALKTDPDLGGALTSGALRPYRPMPPLLLEGGRARRGDARRTLTVGLLPAKESGHRHEIVGVEPATGMVRRFDRGAPEGATASEHVCGPPDAGQPTVSRGTPGQYEVMISQGETELWRFTAIRPAASSGTNGSGIELVGVDYRGKRVLGRAHAPILNVLYDPGNHGCGPAYRDWQWQEGMIQADGEDVAEGFRRCATPPQTIFESGSDQGNFLGVAIYATAQEVILVSELEAGWYRYVSEWRFYEDGTIRPRFGFAGVNNSCVCEVHHHHVYWRFDFDIRTPENNRVREYNDPPLAGEANWHTLETEERRERDPGRRRYWRVENTKTGEGYTIIPGQNDGSAEAGFGVGDLWALREHDGAEFDDGQDFTTDPEEAKAQLDPFVNGERIDDHDVVVWYAGHFKHDIEDEHDTPHIVGPELKPVNW